MPAKPTKPTKPAKPAKIAKAAAAAPSSCLELVLGFLQTDDWPHETAEDGSAVMTGYEGDNGQFEVTIEVNDEAALVVVHVALPVVYKAGQDEEPMDDAAFGNTFALAMRLNGGLALGNFDLDMDDGSLRFRLGLLLAECPLAPEIVRNHLYAAVEAADRFMPLFVGTASGELDCDSALEKLNEAD